MRSVFVIAAACLCIVFGATVDQWKGRAIYQIMTDRFAQTTNTSEGCANLSDYCGGTFQGVINHLDYITGMGFDAIWISPIPTNTPGGYHGYWQQDIFTVNDYFGTQQDLVDLVDACHNAGVWVMLDVVGNHMGNQVNQENFTLFTPFNTAEYFHNNCEINFNLNNANNTQYCRLDGLPDLDQNNTFVADTLIKWIGQTVSSYGFDALRIDTVPEVNWAFWQQYTASAGCYCVGEVFNGNTEYYGFSSEYQTAMHFLGYPMYFTALGVYAQGQSMNGIQGMWQDITSSFSDYSAFGNFLDNQDNARFLSYTSDYQLYKNALAYNLLAEGVPIVYYGTEQGFNGNADNNNNREVLWTTKYDVNAPLYQYIAFINAFRQTAMDQIATQTQIQRYSTNNFYAFTRGTVFVATTNAGTGNDVGPISITYHPYSNGEVLCDIFFPTTDCVTVTNGAFSVYLQNGQCKVYYPQSELLARGWEAVMTKRSFPTGLCG